jgi:hypothetical protein
LGAVLVGLALSPAPRVERVKPAEKLRAEQAGRPNWRREWTRGFIGFEGVLVPDKTPGPVVLPVRYALQLLVDEFGVADLHELIDDGVRDGQFLVAADPHG